MKTTIRPNRRVIFSLPDIPEAQKRTSVTPLLTDCSCFIGVIGIVGRWRRSETIKEQTEAAHLHLRIPAAGSVCLHLCASLSVLKHVLHELTDLLQPARSQRPPGCFHPFGKAVAPSHPLCQRVLTSTLGPVSRSSLTDSPSWDLLRELC